jgi:hypothetical protein
MTSCALCLMFDAGGHPGHPEVPRCGDQDYEALRRRQTIGRSRKAGRIRLVYGGCWRKIGFESPERAKRAAKRTENPSVHSFHCRHCGKFHIGKSDRVGS